MKILLCMHGKPKDKRILEVMEEYKLKIGRYQKFEFEFLNTFSGIDGLVNKYKGKKIYFLDEDGKEFTSEEFAKNYEKDLNNGEKEVVFVIGPAEGFGDVKGLANLISLSKMALQHDLAGLLLTEQIYRAVSIKNNLPYHRS